jgi:hypothetical protein
VAAMPSAARELRLDQSTDRLLYTKAELIDLRRTELLYANFCLDMSGTNTGRSRGRPSSRVSEPAKADVR